MKSISVSDISLFVRYVLQYESSQEDGLFPSCACEYRLAYIWSGSGTSIINGISYPVQRGDLLFYGPGVPYRHIPTLGSRLGLLKINFDFTKEHRNVFFPIRPSPPEQFHPDDIVEQCRFTDFPQLNDTIHLRNMFEFEPQLFTIVREFREQQLFYQQRVEALVTELLFSVMRLVSVRTSRSPELVEAVLSYVHSHYRESLSNQEIADALGYSPSYINKQLNLYTGKPLHQYLLDFRLSRAIDLLAHTDLSVTEIAEQVGFGSLIHFEKSFKSRLGVTPMVIRNK